MQSESCASLSLTVTTTFVALIAASCAHDQTASPDRSATAKAPLPGLSRTNHRSMTKTMTVSVCGYDWPFLNRGFAAYARRCWAAVFGPASLWRPRHKRVRMRTICRGR